MLYRGKYCGKSQLRKKTNEFGPQPSMRGQYHSNTNQKDAIGVTSRASRVSRSAIGSKRTRNHPKEQQMHTVETPDFKKFYPEEYYKRTG